MSQKRLAELLPELTALLSEDTRVSTAKKQPKNRGTMAVTNTHKTEKFKPLTLAEMYADIEVVSGRSAKRNRVQSTLGPQTSRVSSIKKRWNSSVKIDKKISHTKDGQMKHNHVRKVLNFQSKPQQSFSNKRETMALASSETPKFPKPAARAKKTLHQLQTKNTVRISGVYKIPETPLDTKPIIKSRISIANKEHSYPKAGAEQPIFNQAIRKIIIPQPITPMFNDSWKSSCDASFLQKEQDIKDLEEKAKAIPDESALSNIAEVSPPVSTPFKEYRNVIDYFNYSSDMEKSISNHIIKCLDRPSTINEVTNMTEETVIVSLCDLFNKATVMQTENGKSELEFLLQMKEETENNITKLLKLLKSQRNLLYLISRQIQQKSTGSNAPIEMETTLTEEDILSKACLKKEKTPEKSTIFRCTVIKSPAKSPSYKIPKRSPCLRKKVFHTSMPDKHIQKASTDNGGQAMAMYMNMKEQNLNFLNTPVAKQRPTSAEVPDTPALTSRNLQTQLDKLYNS